jgi:hypothetical protein
LENFAGLIICQVTSYYKGLKSVKKQILFCLTILLLAGCGEKSKIKNSVKAERLQDTHLITFPLEDTSLAYKTPLPGLAPIVGGIMKLVGDIFAKNTKMGEIEMSYIQPIPEIPEILESVRMKRFFFYLKPRKTTGRRFKDKVSALFDRYVLGKGDPTFGFLDKLAVKMSVERMGRQSDYSPIFVSEIRQKDEVNALLKLFEEDTHITNVNSEKANDVVLLRYHKKRKLRDTSSDKYGSLHYMEIDVDKIKEDIKSRRPGIKETELVLASQKKLAKLKSDLKQFLSESPIYSEHFKRVLLFESSILVELTKDPVSDELFFGLLNENADLLEQEYFVTYIDTCTELSCLELNVPDTNLVPIAKKGNALKLTECQIHSSSKDLLSLKLK